VTQGPQLDAWIGDIARSIPRSPGWAVLSAGVVAGLGLCTLCVHLFHLISVSESLLVTLLGTLMPMALSLILLVSGVWIYRRHPPEVVILTGSWCFATTVILIAVSVVSILYQTSKGVLMTDLLFVMANHASVGGLLGVIMGIYDGQRHRKERTFQRERDRAQMLSDRLSILNRVLRHDIRNSINVIQGNASLIQAGERDPDQAAATIYSQATELQAVSDQARRLKQLMKRAPIEDRTVDVGAIIQEKTGRVRDTYPAVEFETEIPGSVDIRAPLAIETAVEELLENAAEHNDADSPRVAVSVSAPDTGLQADGGERGTVCIRIRDNGPGIPEEQLEVLDRGRETALNHTNGLGLWLVRWVVDASDGEIDFDTDDSDGSTVVIRLPAGR
jgi:signal transduction histidine kinase